MANSIKICSVNCRGLNDKMKRRDVFKYIRNKKYSIYCLQDVHWENKWGNMIRSEWGYEIYIAGNTSNSRGVAILINNNFDFKVQSIDRDPTGNWIIMNINMLSMDITLCCLYGPNDDQPTFYNCVKETIENVGNPYCIICGDFNLVQDQQMDTFNYVNINNPKAKEMVLKIKDDFDLSDPWRVLNPDKKRYTWRKNNPIKQARLDFFLISSEMLNIIDFADIIPGYRTDHSMVVIGLNNNNNIRRGRGSWKLNNDLLRDNEYVNTVKEIITKVKKIYAVSPYDRDRINDINPSELELTIDDQLFFETLLMEIRGATLAFSSKRKKNLDKTEENLDYRVTNLEKLYEEALVKKDQDPEIILNELNTVKSELKAIRNKKIRGSIIRTKAKWVEDGEKPSKYFLNLEKRNYVNKQISRIVRKDDTVAMSQEDIETEILSFYKTLYKENKVESNVSIEDCNVNITRLTTIQANGLEGELELSELLNALKNMKNNKTPGPDGFTAEFYKMFWTDISVFLLRSLNQGFRNGSLTKEQKAGHVTLLPKGDKPRHFIKNWRPISLLNVSYKLASACIANRIKSVLPNLISEDQTGFVPNRFIGENVRLLYDLLNYTDVNKIPGMLLLIDFEKAFDTVSHDFILKTLKAFKFGNDIRRWFETLYKNASSSVIINGNISRPFQIQRSCRQGDPLSPYIFVLCAEILASMIRGNENIRGIQIRDLDFKITQYADDTTLILDGSEKSLQNAMSTLNKFRDMSGLKINNDKTVAVWIGSFKNRNTKICNNLKINWNFNGTFDFLGVIFDTDLDEMISHNYNKSLQAMTKMISNWKKRNLTVLGRVVVIKSLVLPKLSYVAQMLPNPDKEFIKEVNNMFYKYVWNDKPDRVKRNQFVQNYENGGVKMPDVESHINALKINWIRRFTRDEKKWIKLSELCLNVPSKDICSMGLERFKMLKTSINNKFWYDVLFAWSLSINIVNHSNLDFNRIAKQYLWWNDKIKIGNKVVKYGHWIKRGVMFVNDLLNTDGTFMTKASFEETYSIRTNILEFNGIIRAIKSSFGINDVVGSRLPLPIRPSNIEFLFKQASGCKSFYDVFILLKNRNHTKNKWQDEFELDDKDWKGLCRLNFKFSIDTKYRWFQYRINQNIIATNILLAKLNIKDNDLCSFCKTVSETIYHLFVGCHISETFWNDIKAWVKDKTNLDLNFAPCTILFGFQNNYILTLVVNLAKFHLYKAKMVKKLPNLESFKQEIKYYFNILKYQSCCNMDKVEFVKKWFQLLPLVT